MKRTLLFFLIFLMMSFYSCKENLILPLGQLTFRSVPTASSQKKDSVVFTESDINKFNATTGELSFNETSLSSGLKNFYKLKCYIGTDSLFVISLTSDIMSSIRNDLVLNHNLQDGKYYFQDGYPAWLPNVQDSTLRAQNKLKRAVPWNIFIEKMKILDKYQE